MFFSEISFSRRLWVADDDSVKQSWTLVHGWKKKHHVCDAMVKSGEMRKYSLMFPMKEKQLSIYCLWVWGPTSHPAMWACTLSFHRGLVMEDGFAPHSRDLFLQEKGKNNTGSPFLRFYCSSHLKFHFGDIGHPDIPSTLFFLSIVFHYSLKGSRRMNVALALSHSSEVINKS